MNFSKSIISYIFAIFKYFMKQTIYSDSTDQVIQTTCLNFKSLKFFLTSKNGLSLTIS